MPAAKYGQLGVLDGNEANRDYVNVHYLETSYRCGKNCAKVDWKQPYSSMAGDRDTAFQGKVETTGWTREVEHGVMIDYQKSGNKSKTIRGQFPNQLCSEFSENSNSQLYTANLEFGEKQHDCTFDNYQALDIQPVWRKPSNRKNSFEDLTGEAQTYEKYPFCKSFQSSTSNSRQVYCNDARNSNVLISSAEYFSTEHSDPAQPLRSSIVPITNSRVCTEQSGLSMSRVSKVDLAIQHCHQTKVRQLNLQTSEYANLPKQYSVESDSADFASCHQRQSDDQQVARNDFKPEMRGSDEKKIKMKAISLSSVAKLGSQIQGLREEMLDLRSTTLSFKEHMEKMFEDLKIVSRMNFDWGKSPWLLADNQHAAIQHLVEYNNSNNGSSTPVNKSMFRLPTQGKKMVVDFTTRNRATFEDSKRLTDDETGFSGTPSRDMFHTESSHNEVEGVQLQKQTEKISKRGKATERPNSDPFASCIDSNRMFTPDGGPPLSTMSLPHSQPAGTKCVGTTSKNKTESIRIPSVLSRSNTGLYFSECSIDSGYQDSSVTTPRDRLGHSVITPALLNSNESSLKSRPTREQVRDVTYEHQPTSDAGGLDSMKPTTHQRLNNRLLSETPELHADTERFDTYSKRSASVEFLEVFTPDQDGYQPNFNQVSSCAPVRIIKLKSPEGSNKMRPSSKSENDVIPKPRSTKSSIDSETSDEPKQAPRPVPKQRTVFAQTNLNKADEKLIGSDTSKDNLDEKAIPASLHNGKWSLPNQLVKQYEETGNSKVVDQNQEKKMSTKTLAASAGTWSNDELLSSKQCFTSIKSSPLTLVQPGSPLISRVKLGVSAIPMQPSPIIGRKDVTTNCKKDDQKTRSDVKRSQGRTTTAKQILREKYAAAAEKSAASNRNAGGDCSDGESSVVRRRSMRMMTEFQVFDFKDCNFNSTSKNNGLESSPPAHLMSPATPDSNYSPSPSAATLSKRIFDSNKSNASLCKDMQVSDRAKVVIENGVHNKSSKNTFKNTTSCLVNYLDKNQVSSYVSKPLPSTPSLSPPSPPLVADTPPSLYGSQTSLFSEVELVPQSLNERPSALPVTPVIKPKASLPGVSCDITNPPSMQKTALKRSPTRKSAFTPVWSSLKSVPHKASPIIGRQEVPFYTEQDDSAFDPSEFKRRVSLPLTSVSNRQKFLNELTHKDGDKSYASTPDNDQASDFQRRSSLRAPRKNKEALIESIAATELATAKSNNLTKEKTSKATKEDKTQSKTKAVSTTTKSSSDSKPTQERRRHVSADKTKSSHPSTHLDLESQPISFNRSEKISDVVGALRTAGYLPNGNVQQTTQQVSATTSQGSNKKQTKECKQRTQPAVQSLTRTNKVSTGDLRSHKVKTTQEKNDHETVGSADSFRAARHEADEKFHDHVMATIHSKAVQPLGGAVEAPPSPSRHKSTVALLRASLMGKREKPPRSSTAEGKRDAAYKIEPKARSASTSSKKDIRILNVKSKDTKEKNSDSKSNGKKKHEAKPSKEKSSKKASKEQCFKSSSLKKNKEHSLDSPSSSTGPPLPDSGPRLPGNSDAEVMERFLAAAAASHTVRSPLQRLRSSFRTPRNKTKLLQAARVKDDMAVAGGRSSSFMPSRHDKNFLPKQDQLTYV